MNSKKKCVQYPCDKREFAAKSYYFLKRHEDNTHLHIKYSCEYCKYTATVKGSLKKHMDFTHLGVKYLSLIHI